MRTNIIIILATAGFCLAQNIQNAKNLNPDPDGNPWYIDGYVEPKDKRYVTDQEINLVLSSYREESVALPLRVDHSFSSFMRPVFSQDGGSCGSASRICYMFAYELNNYRQVSGALPENIYPSHFTWMLTGQNSSKEEMAIFNGIPNAVVYGGDTYSKIYGQSGIEWPADVLDYGWMQGFDKWMHAMSNRLEKNLFIDLNTPENLNFLKGWLSDHHGDGSFSEGGVAGAGCAISDVVLVTIPEGLPGSGKQIVKAWGPQVDHGTTWSGYDDRIGYDFNGDGLMTNDIDITDDGKVDMADWERGSMIMLNSWGDSWANDGTVYVPYRLLKINNMGAELYYIHKDYQPRRVLKIYLDYSQRSRIKLSVGISADTSATVPEKMTPCHHFIFAGGGPVPMLGRWADGNLHNEAMEFGIDVSGLAFGFDTREPLKYFLTIESKGDADGIGQVQFLSLIDFETDTSGIEYVSPHSGISIAENGATTTASVIIDGNPESNPEYVFVPQSSMTVKYVDSQETVGEDGKAQNAVDGDPLTIWHTEWYYSVPPTPHEIQLDLHGEYQVNGLSYLPRQIGVNGRIADYEIYVSSDAIDWGTAVAEGKWENTPAQQWITFDYKQGRYLRLIALSEVNDNAWTSVAELNVLSTVGSTSIKRELPYPNEYILYQNFPNPFNPVTTIKFIIPSSQHVSLKIYDTKGQAVTVLVDENLNAGSHVMEWRADGFASGIYYCRLIAGEYTSTRKLILLK